MPSLPQRNIKNLDPAWACVHLAIKYNIDGIKGSLKKRHQRARSLSEVDIQEIINKLIADGYVKQKK